MTRIRTRFAPSPTGDLHVGGLRTALYAFLHAKKHGGDFLLRVEDTDRAREKAGALDQIVRILQEFALVTDDGPAHANAQATDAEKNSGWHADKKYYLQSERLALYKTYAEQLVEKGAAFHSDGAIKLKVDITKVAMWEDAVRGSMTIPYKGLDYEPVLLKSDGFATYHLANVVDDHLMGITHVFRGEEWLASTPIHLAIYHAFGWDVPQFAHVNLLLGSDHKKLSKREGSTSVDSFVAAGYPREALLNFLLLLGWNPKSTQEFFTLQEMIEAWDINKLNKAGSVFDRKKLDWMSGQYMRKMALEDFASRVRTAAPDVAKEFAAHTDAQTTYALDLGRQKAATFVQVYDEIDFAWKEITLDASLLAWKKMTTDDVRKVLTLSRDLLIGLEDGAWEVAPLKERFTQLAAEHQVKFGELLYPLRVALTGKKASPGAFECLQALGKTRSLARIEAALQALA